VSDNDKQPAEVRQTSASGARKTREPDPCSLSRAELIDYLHHHPTVSLWPFAGRALGLSRSLTYRCEEIKILRLGHRRLVASSWLERFLFGEQ
jgi:hypothetical protein